MGEEGTPLPVEKLDERKEPSLATALVRPRP
jgi:hypothetical protein